MKRPAARGKVAPLLGGGRPIKRLLFVTSRAGLAANVGADAVDQALAMIRDGGHAVLSTLRAGLTHPKGAQKWVARALAKHDNIHGVVVLGGYDVVPAQRLDCLPPRLRKAIGETEDHDDFIVWSDDLYGDPDGNGVADYAVSRIPDGRSARLLLAALTAPAHANERATRRGLRNKLRPFADGVFAKMPGTGSMRRSSPTTDSRLPRSALHGSHVYLMLHGLPGSGGRFWGESSRGHPVAMCVDDAPGAGAVVLSGCCWSGLIAQRTARLDHGGAPPRPRIARGSVALAALGNGARAFVGSTGENWSPTNAPYEYFSAPLHRAFWRSLLAGAAPAKALLEAKHAFALRMPHGVGHGTLEEAIEFKTARQYTCLGLGW
jgi:hypothetical protein